METVVSSSLFAVGGNGVYTASTRRVEITLGYEELGSSLYPRGPEYRFSESRWSALSMGSPVQNGSTSLYRDKGIATILLGTH